MEEGGVAYVLSREYGLDPKAMHPEVGMLVNEKADSESRELPQDEIFTTFKADIWRRTTIETGTTDTSKEPGRRKLPVLPRFRSMISTRVSRKRKRTDQCLRACPGTGRVEGF